MAQVLVGVRDAALDEEGSAAAEVFEVVFALGILLAAAAKGGLV